MTTVQKKLTTAINSTTRAAIYYDPQAHHVLDWSSDGTPTQAHEGLWMLIGYHSGCDLEAVTDLLVAFGDDLAKVTDCDYSVIKDKIAECINDIEVSSGIDDEVL